MKISVNAPLEKIDYKIETKYGLLECTFYYEGIDMHFFKVFSSFPEDKEYEKSFEFYKDRAVEVFAEQFPKRLAELLEETAEEVQIKTLIEIKGISRQEAKRRIEKYLKDSEKKKKKRMSAPSSGRPKKRDREALMKAVIKQLKESPPHMNPTLNWVANKLDFPSGQALRKELKRNNIDWKELKNGHKIN